MPCHSLTFVFYTTFLVLAMSLTVVFHLYFDTQALERKGNLRYIRYSNQGDVVAVAPFGFGYRQTGLHAFLLKNTVMEVGFPNWKRSTTQFRLPSTMNTAHSLAEHKVRLEQDYNAELLLSKTVGEFFDEYYTGADDSSTP